VEEDQGALVLAIAAHTVPLPLLMVSDGNRLRAQRCRRGRITQGTSSWSSTDLVSAWLVLSVFRILFRTELSLSPVDRPWALWDPILLLLSAESHFL
jgi:hypothetical protein